MDTVTLISDWVTRLSDGIFGWLLLIPRDLAIFVVAAGTSFLLTYVRRWTTNQDRLMRSKGDLQCLKELMKEAKRNKDKAALKRMKLTKAAVNVLRMKAELWPLLVSILPIAVLATWAWQRLDCFPPKVGEAVTVKAYYPHSAVGGLTYMMPPPAGLKLDSAPIQAISEDPKVGPNGERNGVAAWTVTADRKCPAAALSIRYQGRTVTHTLSVGEPAYEPPIEVHPGSKIDATEVVLTQAKWLGFVRLPSFVSESIPGIETILPPWLIAYLIIVIPLVPALRKLLKIY